MHIHSFNPKANFLQTVLNQTGKKKYVKWWFLQGNLKNRKIYLIRNVIIQFHMHSFSDCNSIENVPKTTNTAKIVGYR